MQRDKVTTFPFSKLTNQKSANASNSIVGSALVYATGSVGSRYAGLLLMGIYSAAMPISMAMISSNVGGFTKKATVSAIYFIMYCTGNIIGPQLFFSREAPKYQVCFQLCFTT